MALMLCRQPLYEYEVWSKNRDGQYKLKGKRIFARNEDAARGIVERNSYLFRYGDDIISIRETGRMIPAGE